jgi:hypothetical protein
MRGKTFYLHCPPPTNTTSLAGQAAILIGGNGLFQGLVQNPILNPTICTWIMLDVIDSNGKNVTLNTWKMESAEGCLPHPRKSLKKCLNRPLKLVTLRVNPLSCFVFHSPRILSMLIELCLQNPFFGAVH